MLLHGVELGKQPGSLLDTDLDSSASLARLGLRCPAACIPFFRLGSCQALGVKLVHTPLGDTDEGLGQFDLAEVPASEDANRTLCVGEVLAEPRLLRAASPQKRLRPLPHARPPREKRLGRVPGIEVGACADEVLVAPPLLDRLGDDVLHNRRPP
ncbi:MAG: hypothetical protein ACOZNI_21185 [Myxococcota bacterium]